MATTEQWKDIESKYYMFLVRRQPMVLAVSFTHLTMPTILLV